MGGGGVGANVLGSAHPSQHPPLRSTSPVSVSYIGLQVIAALEQQQGALSEREAALRKAEEAAGQQVQAALVERDQAVAKETQARR
jgi:hypothetical protein